MSTPAIKCSVDGCAEKVARFLINGTALCVNHSDDVPLSQFARTPPGCFICDQPVAKHCPVYCDIHVEEMGGGWNRPGVLVGEFVGKRGAEKLRRLADMFEASNAYAKTKQQRCVAGAFLELLDQSTALL